MIPHRAPRPRPLALAALSLVAGLLIGLGGSTESHFAAAALIAILAAAAALLLDDRRTLVAAALLSTGVAGVVIGLTERQEAGLDCRSRWAAGKDVVLVAVAVSYLPEGVRGSVRVRPVTNEEGNGCAWAGDLRVWTEGPVRPGARYGISGAWQPARTPGLGPRAPARRGWIAAVGMTLEGAPEITRHPFLAARGALAGKLWHIYPRRWAPLAQALVLGQRETMDPKVTERIARAGLAHLLAISGLHVGMLAAAFFGLARALRLPVRRAHVVTVVLTFGYVLLIGAPASAVRAALMVFLWMLSRVAGRASSAFDVLGLSAVLLLLARPWSVVEPGFQLSFAGAAAVGYAYSEARRLAWLNVLPKPLRAAAVAALASAAVVALTAPITVTYFGRVAPAAVAGNLVAIPLLALAMPALFLSALLVPWPALAAWPAGAAVVVLRAIDGLAQVLGNAPGASFEMTRPGPLPALAYVVLLVLGVHALHGAWQRRRFVLALGFVWAVAIVWPAVRSQFPAGRLVVYVLDVGQGDAIAVRTPGRHWLLVDAGPRIRGFDAGKQRVVPFLREQGASHIEAWIASHPDLDHVGGFPSIARAIDVRRVIGVGHVTGQIGQIAVLRSLARDTSTWFRADAGDRLSIDGVTLTFLHPPGDLGAGGPPEPNELSLVFRLDYGEFRMLFAGDVPGAVEDRLSFEDSMAIRVQVLKVSHHGSATSTSRRFLSVVRPELAIISVGRGNTYGHPSPHTLGRLAVAGIPTRRTDRDGTVVIEAEFDGNWQVRSAAEGF